MTDLKILTRTELLALAKAASTKEDHTTITKILKEIRTRIEDENNARKANMAKLRQLRDQVTRYR